MRQIATNVTTIYLHPDQANGLLYEKDTVGVTVTHKHYIEAGGQAVALVTLVGSSWSTKYLHRDHLGSVSAVTDVNGAVLERLAYEPFGKRRFPNGTRDANETIVGQQTDRGFTNHEELDDLGLIHMNARIYDPATGRFMSADPVIPSALDIQSYNRYSYVGNNPLSLTDPTGNCPICIAAWVIIGAEAAHQVGLIDKQLTRTIQGIAAAWAVGGPGGLLNGGFAGAVAGGFAGGFVSSDFNLKGGLYGAVQGGLFYGVGELTKFHGATFKDFLEPNHLANIAGHAAVGCAMASAQGGKCGAGAAAAGFGAVFAPVVPPGAAGLVITSVVGGTASVLGGGKFANGAVTAAFGYLFNQLTQQGQESMEEMRARARASLESRYGGNPNYVLSFEVDGHFRIDPGDGSARPLVRGRPDAVVVDKAAGTVMLCEFKGGMCSSYTPAQRLYLGKPVVEAWFGGHSEVNRMFSGYSTHESGYKVVAPEIFTNAGSRVDRSGVTRQIRSRGGRVGGRAP